MLRVTGDTVRDCNLKMHHLEIDTMLGIKRKNEMVMIDEIYSWFKNVKKPAYSSVKINLLYSSGQKECFACIYFIIGEFENAINW